MGIFDAFRKKEKEDVSQAVITEYQNFYSTNRNEKISFYGLIEYNEHGPEAIYDIPYSETIHVDFPFESECVWEEWPEQQVEEMRQKVQYGTIAIASEGCNIYWLLVVNGAHAGNVWLYTESGVTPVAPNMNLAVWKSRCLESGNTFWRDAVKNWGEEENDFFYGHVAAKMVNQEQFSFAVSSPMCRICYNMMLNFAKNTGQAIVITDPIDTKVIKPDLTVEHIIR
ncbi:MAG: hypothetical protein ACOYJB_09145 [Christensenellaceae bacterium]|jgi:hypothetical protein